MLEFACLRWPDTKQGFAYFQELVCVLKQQQQQQKLTYPEARILVQVQMNWSRAKKGSNDKLS